MFELTKNILKKSYVLVEFGALDSHNWMSNPLLADICTDYRIIMQDRARYSFKLTDLIETLDGQLRYVSANAIADTSSMESNQSQHQPVDVFISYSWANSHEAVAKGTKKNTTSLGWLDPRSLLAFFRENGINAWLDTHEKAATRLFAQIANGLTRASVMVACFSDEYVRSKNCALEFRFAHVSLRIPIVKVFNKKQQNFKQNLNDLTIFIIVLD